MYQVYLSERGIDALVCFPFADHESIFPFRDSLTRVILEATDLCVHKGHGYPLPPDSLFRLYSRNHDVHVKEFLRTRYPGFFARLLRTTEWRSYRKAEEEFAGLIDIEIETSHDFPCIVASSRLHSENDISELIEAVAKGLGMDMPRSTKLPPIKDVVTSNRRFQLQSVEEKET